MSPNEKENYFSDLIENHPLESTFSRWIEFDGYVDSRAAVIFQDSFSRMSRRHRGRIEEVWSPRVYEGAPPRILRRYNPTTETWESYHYVTEAPVAPGKKVRLYANTTNRLRLSESGGNYRNVLAINDGLLNQCLRFDSGASGVAQGSAPDIFWDTSPACTVRRTADQTLTNNTDTIINFDSEDDDNANLHDNVTNNGRITFNRAGRWIFGLRVRFAANATGVRYAGVIKNGAGGFLTFYRDTTPHATFLTDIELTESRRFAASDYIEAHVLQDSGGNLACVATAELSPVFWAVWLSP